MLMLLGVGACDTPSGEEFTQEVEEAIGGKPIKSPPVINIDRSLMVVDLQTLETKDSKGNFLFSLERVLGQLAATSGSNPGLDAAKLYQSIYDTNNTKAGGLVPDGQHCDDEKDASGNAVLNGFRIECPRQEGALADLSKHNPFCSGPNCDPYSPLAIVNRFDLAPANGQTCGQYRMIFGKGFQQSPLETAGNQLLTNRNLLIFEAVMPNPKPTFGLKGCAKVVEFWAGLSNIHDPAQRAAELERFFFKGYQGLPAAFQWDHFTGEVDPKTGEQVSGQIRSNQFLNDPTAGGLRQPWQLREYNLRRTCSGKTKKQNCKPEVRMVPTGINPEASLFSDDNTSPRALKFRDPSNAESFINQIPALAIGDPNLFNMNRVGREFNGGQSTSQPALQPGGPPVANDSNYNLVFSPTGPFAAKIQAKLSEIGSSLKPSEIVRRAQSQACAGCHELSTSTAPIFGGVVDANKLGENVQWPDVAQGPEVAPGVRPNAFTQVSDSLLVPTATGVTCNTVCTAQPSSCLCAWAVSPALATVFLPFRRDNMVNYLKSLSTGGNPHPGDDEGTAF
ncbi:hypothetical protein [Polyangium sp. y55x31]|uniref:hypothetical protein n=1 Tax=Polyangium sp. y55x31 TaxID=3042688 RepID=UPI002482738D|nr:hypothetical protein [Polyangium sp. y55x31]MDI1479814.1 hypothetical protein [Polyangium sp. y55x31]